MILQCINQCLFGVLSRCNAIKQNRRFFVLILALICIPTSAFGQDENATRNQPPPDKTNRKFTNPNPNRNIKKSSSTHLATLKINVSPQDSKILFDGQEFEMADPSRGLQLTGLKKGEHRLVVMRSGYVADERSVILKPGENEPLNITLEPLKGKLDVAPSIADSEIRIDSVAGSQRSRVGTYQGRVNSLELPPGIYEVTVFKSGYHNATRRISINHGESLYLEPQLEPLPKPTPTPALTRSIAPIPMRSTVETEGKYIIVRLQGASGDLAKTVGSINVTLGGPGGNTVSGSLSGQPCRIQLVQLENVAEGSLVEAPGPSNLWASVVVRVRPKTSKHLIAFAINWMSLQGTLTLPTSSPSASLVEAVVIKKIVPNFPSEARHLRVSGTVTVSIVINAQGEVVSANAIDGPSIFRRTAEEAARKWKYRPATRDGRLVESTQTIRFDFTR